MKPLKVETFINVDHFVALGEADAKFILEHAEKQLKDTVDSSGLLVARLTTLVSITAAFMAGLTGYGVTRGITEGFRDRYVITAFIDVGYLYIPALLIVWNFLSQKYYHVGSEPKSFFVPKIFEDNKEEKMKAIYCYEIMDVQARIVANKMKNKRRWLRFNIATTLLLLSPVILYLIYTFIAPMFLPSR